MMTGLVTTLPRQAWLRIFRKTFLILGISIAASVVTTVVFMGTFSAGVNMPGLLIAIIVPICIGGPMTFIFALGGEKLRFANDQLMRLASVDGLTGLFNRRAFTLKVERQCGSSKGAGTLLVLDVDHFKSINDRFGHDKGDEALIEIAGVLATATGSDGIAGRLGGEEFGVYLPRMGLDAAAIVAGRIRAAMADILFMPDGTPCPISVSIGGSSHAKSTSFRDLYREADQFLYQAKQWGRDRVALPQAA
ncbi:GGDEF domain-containing protein [Devosia sp. Leaf64]|uniref:GGDEF domain-containing protein n=1 Tax=Devosia sp. Leaf64 TaxID=1736229 RepID=UPI0007148240|nr:GGDEF domain-containing protein [Devosia sp. Leaf64]KQN77295.1 hypothetical protein ASE94_17515 [Devosia sp. Leaf64]